MDDKVEKSSFKSKDSISIEENVPYVQSEEEKKLVKKINWTFVPFVVVILFIQFVDKTTLSIISVMDGFFEDTGISADQYSWLGSFFYLGYLCMQLPNNYMLQRLPISKYVGSVIFIWGICLLCMAWAHNFGQLAGLRFLLGFFEAVTYPAMFLLIATMYRRSEQVMWFGVMFISNGIAVILGNFIGVGVMKMPTVGDIVPWKWMLIIFGAVTSLLGIIYFFFLPDKPASRWFRLSEIEKSIIEERTRDNAVVPTLQVNYSQIWEALKEPRFYCYCLISLFVNFQNGALTIFSSLIISDMGFSNMNAILLNIPSGVVNMLIIYISTLISKRTNEICYVAMGTTTISMIGLILLMAIPSGGAKLSGLYLSWGCTASYVFLQSSISSNVSGYSKKIFYTSGNLVFYTFGNFIGPLLLRSQDAPRYFMGLGVYVAANVLAIICFAIVRISYVRANKKKHPAGVVNTAAALTDDLEDLTDVQNQNFVYRT